MISSSLSSSLLSKTVALVTGGSSGLGAAVTKWLVRHGARVVVADLEHQEQAFLGVKQQALLQCRQQEDSRTDDNLTFAATDVTDSDQVSAALDRAESAFGRPVCAAINCAGLVLMEPTVDNAKGGRAEPHSLDAFMRILTVNAVGTFNVSRLAAQRMLRNDANADGLRGCIIHTASVAAYEARMGTVAYAASKGAVVGMTLPMARDLASSGIRVVSIAPGPFDTPLMNVLPKEIKSVVPSLAPCPNRLGHPDEFGHLVVGILNNPMLNGSVVRLDGAVRLPHVNQ